jgi:hypothetical protein
MRQSQLPLLGLLFALFVGARVGLPGTASGGGPTTGSAGKGHSSSSQLVKEGAGQVSRHTGAHLPAVPTAATASNLVQSGCDEITATSKASTFHISKSLRTSADCVPPLPAIYRILCQLNTHYNSDDEMRDRLNLVALLAEKPSLPQCLAGLGADGAFSIESVMASVPDPEHTHLGLLTDRTIDAIQVAAGKRHYNPYSHFLPWTSSDSQKNPDDSSDGDAGADPHQPGLLIFRKDEPINADLKEGGKGTKTHYLAVFLISELPTTGLDQQSFYAAKTITDQISDQLKQAKPQFLSFAGPNFSGSLASLEDIDHQLGDAQCIHAFSGQVTAAQYYKAKQGCESGLVLTQTSDSDAVHQFVTGLRDYGYQRNEIAVLSEGGTVFGNRAAKDEPEDEAGKPQNSSACAALSLQFPRDISKLRNAYGAVTGQTIPASGSTTTQQNVDVQMTWQDSQAARGDDVPTYGGQQTPLSQDAVLSTLATALKACGTRVLGIFATDPMDEAFLIRSFRKSSPDVRLFLRDPDLLYLRTPDVGSLNGTLLVNNYPLLVRNQLWSGDNSGKDGDHHGLVTFSSAGQEAQYDAFLFLLNEMQNNASPSDLVEWNQPSANPGSKETLVAPPSLTTPLLRRPSLPPLWLTTMGTAGHLPVAILGVDESIESKLLPRSLDVGGPRQIGRLLWMFFAVLGVLHVWGLSLPNALPRLFADDFDLGDARDTITASKAVCHVAILLSLALVQLVLGSSYLFFRQLSAYFWWVILLALALAVTACVVFTIRVAWPWWQTRGGVSLRNQEILGILRPLVGGALCILIFGAIGAFWIGRVFQPTFGNAFLHFRDLMLSSGVAPCLPIVLLLLIAYLGAWAYLRRLTYWGYRKPPLPTLALDSVFPSDFTKAVRSIDKCIVGLLESPAWSIAFLLVFLAGVLAFRPWATMDMTEVLTVRGIVFVLFVLAFFTLSLNWFRFVNIWFRLRNILEGLERLPIRHAFERMPAEKSMPIWGWGISDNSFLPTSQAVERLDALVLADKIAVTAQSVQELRSRVSVVGKLGEQKRLGIWGSLVLLLRSPRMQLVELPRAVGASPMMVSVKATRERGMDSPDTPTNGDLLNGARQAMTIVLHQLIVYLSDYWRRGSDGSKQEIPPPPEVRRFVLAEDLIAMRYYTYVRYVVTELRNLLFFIAMAFSLLFLAFHTYAFRADQAIDWSFLVLFLILGTGVTVVLYQMELDSILSHFGGGQAGEVGWSFYLNLLKYGAVPFLTIIGSQVPAVSNLLLRWLQPTLQSLR